MKTLNYACSNREFKILIGTNAKENWNLIESSDPFDLWFHVKGNPSGHVVIKEISNLKNQVKQNKVFNYPYEVVMEGAKYCKNQSKLKNQKCKIVYTTIENISKGREIGSVFTKNEKYISI